MNPSRTATTQPPGPNKPANAASIRVLEIRPIREICPPCHPYKKPGHRLFLITLLLIPHIRTKITTTKANARHKTQCLSATQNTLEEEDGVSVSLRINRVLDLMLDSRFAGRLLRSPLYSLIPLFPELPWLSTPRYTRLFATVDYAGIWRGGRDEICKDKVLT
jgi:hypothetical protein